MQGITMQAARGGTVDNQADTQVDTQAGKLNIAASRGTVTAGTVTAATHTAATDTTRAGMPQGGPAEDSPEGDLKVGQNSAVGGAVSETVNGNGQSPPGGAGKPAPHGKVDSQADYDARWPSWEEDPDDIEYAKPVQLSAAELVSLSQAAVRGLLGAVATQVVVSIVVAMVAFAVSGSAAGVSALVGAAAYAIPNALFAFKLILSVHKPGGANPVTFFFGEFFKIAFAGLLIFAAASLGREMLVWPAFMAGLVCALKSQWLALAFGRKQK